MLRIADLAGFLRALAPELAARAARAGVVRGAVVIGYGNQVVAVRVTEGRVADVRVDVDTAPAGELPRAVLEPAQWVEVFGGAKPFSAQPFARASSVGEREIVLLDALFPRGRPVFWEIDAF